MNNEANPDNPHHSMKHISSIFHMLSLSIFALIGLVTLSPQQAIAQWTQGNSVNGVRVFLDERTGLEWTETIGQVPSSGWGVPAQALVAQYGFRLPSFRELQVMEANGGFRRLKITTAMQQYYETSNPNVLAAAWGNGFRTPQQRQGTGMNWVIGVREWVIVEGDGFLEPPVSQPTISKPPVSQPTVSKPTVSKPTVSKPTVSKPSTTSKPGGNATNTGKPTGQSGSTSKPSTDKPKPNDSKPVLPTLPSYD